MKIKPKKIIIAVGGLGHEFQVSLSSGRYIFENCPRDSYDPLILLLLPDGRISLHFDLQMFSGEGNLLSLKNGWENRFSLYSLGDWDEMLRVNKINPGEICGVFNIVHGKGGEDGLLNSFFRLQGIPYAGFDFKASQLCFDKHLTKLVWRDRGWDVLDYCVAYRDLGIIDQKAFKLKYPLSSGWCVKPAREGSSVGVSMVFDQQQLNLALESGFTYDSKLLIEPKLNKYRELEVALMKIGDSWHTTRVGEIFNEDRSHYDFDSKYGSNSTKTGLADLPEGLSRRIRSLAIDVVKSLEGEGFARVDFFLHGTQDVYINEVNSLPGFTGISMFPWLWKQEGLNGAALLEVLFKEIKPRG